MKKLTKEELRKEIERIKKEKESIIKSKKIVKK
jgi:hypothetical protein